MNDPQQVKKKGPAVANICCTFIMSGIMLIFFAIYSFNNPDNSKCYVYRDADDNYLVFTD